MSVGDVGGKAIGVAMTDMSLGTVSIESLTVSGSQTGVNQTVTGYLTVQGTMSVGTTAASKVGFHGATPVVQSTAATTVSTTAPVSGAFGFETSAQAIALLTAVNLLIVAMKNHGLMA